jgi:hypothetical protein
MTCLLGFVPGWFFMTAARRGIVGAATPSHFCIVRDGQGGRGEKTSRRAE